jgi:hypothetical protein
VGKSSFARKLMEIAESNGWYTLYLDLQGIKNENEFAEKLTQAARHIKERHSTRLKIFDSVRDFFAKVKKVDVSGVGLEFHDRLEQFYDALDRMLVFDRKALIVIDELAVFLQALASEGDIRRVEFFLNWLRKIRQEKSDSIAWILCSSISITSFVAQNKLSHTINDLYAFNLGEMSTDEASELLRQLCLGAGIESFAAEDTSCLLEKIGWKLPFFVQLFFKKYMELPADEKQASTGVLADRIFDEITSDHQLFTWSERLAGYGRYEEVATMLLTYLSHPKRHADRAELEGVVAASSPEASPKVIFSEVKQMLENDGYLVTDKAGFVAFRSPVIQAYWYNKYVR